MTQPPFDPARIGHNQGPPLNLSGSWAGYCWSRARREAWDNPPIEVVRRRLRRAEELGLTYRQYAGIMLDRGVRTEALVFDLTQLETAPGRRQSPQSPEMLERAAAKLRTLRNCKIFAAAEAAGSVLEELNRRAGGVIADCAVYPGAGAGAGAGAGPGAGAGSVPAAGRVRGQAFGPLPGLETVLQPVLDMLARHLVAPSAAVMIGDGRHARRIAQTARLARVFPGAVYFGPAG